jgi:hypothetical protein
MAKKGCSIMVYKPLTIKTYFQYLKIADWKLEKAKIDWNLYDENSIFVCSIKIAHGKNTKSEVIADSVNKTKKAFEERGIKWPPVKKKLKKS